MRLNRIVTLVLMLLSVGYGFAHGEGQEPTDTEREDVTKMEEATTDFLGLRWSAGIGVIGGFGGDRAVEKASIVNGIVRVEEEGDLRPQVFLEMHEFLRGDRVKAWRKYEQWKSTQQMMNVEKPGDTKTKLGRPPLPIAPRWGYGPFVALQSSDNEAIDALTLGVMLGIRTKNVKNSDSVNIGIGLSFDPSVQVLGGGMKDGQATDEEAVRFKKEGRFGWALMVSFNF